MLETGLYNFDLPQNLIAQTPAHPRASARLLVYRLSDGTLYDARFYDLSKYLHPGTTLVLNNSKVDNCRWLFDDGKTELFVINKSDPYTVRAMVRPGKKFRTSNEVHLTDWLKARVLAIDKEGIRTIRLNVPHDDSRLVEYEHVPLPPYIKQDDNLADEYQTVYAKPPGSLAAPTAGLHFTDELLNKFRADYPITEVTLHVGLGTFAKLTEENIKTGRLHEEWYEINDTSAGILNAADHITAVGTTALRTLESAISDSKFYATASQTDIFIKPGYKFKAVDSLITNFHLPSTSLLMLVAAFIADKRDLSEKSAATELKRIYQHAIDAKYRFYSFGDAMLIV